MSAGWQTVFYGLAVLAFLLAAIVDHFKRPYWPTLVAVGLALVTLVPLWAAASAV